MTIAEAMRELEVLAETGQLPAEVVATLQHGLELRESSAQRKARVAMIVNRLNRLKLERTDVLVLRLPEEEFDDPVQQRWAQSFAEGVAEVAKRGVVIMRGDTPLTVERVMMGGDHQTPGITVPKLFLPGQ